MPRAGLTVNSVVSTATELLDHNPEGITLALLASNLGVRTPSLYKHVDGLAGLERLIGIQAKHNLASALAQSIVAVSHQGALIPLTAAYRQWALAHPGQYRLAMRVPSETDTEDIQASAAVTEPVFAILHSFGIVGDDAIDAARLLRSTIHGFVDLETSASFGLPRNPDHSYHVVVKNLIATLTNWPSPSAAAE